MALRSWGDGSLPGRDSVELLGTEGGRRGGGSSQQSPRDRWITRLTHLQDENDQEFSDEEPGRGDKLTGREAWIQRMQTMQQRLEDERLISTDLREERAAAVRRHRIVFAAAQAPRQGSAKEVG